jgi:hypothetical protein
MKQNLQMRPVYNWVSNEPPEEFVQRLCQLISFDPAVRIQCGKRHAMLRIPEEARHTWSPTLDIQVAPHERGTAIHARLGPEPQVWTFFIFLYVATATPAVIGAMFGLAQLAMGNDPWGLIAIPAGLAAWGLIYLASFLGKGLGAAQIHQLLAVVQASIDEDEEEAPAAQAAQAGSV